MKEAQVLLRDGDQLRLDLFAAEPWDGQSPRVLTRTFGRLFLRQKPPSHEVFFVDPDQYDLWRPIGHPEEKAPPSSSGGALSLLPLKKGVSHGAWKRAFWEED